MGFLSGIFGGSSSESRATTTTSTTTHTTNSTRDIGVTGKDAVALASVVSNAGVQVGAQGVQVAAQGSYQNRDFTRGLFDFAKTLVDGNSETMRMQKEYEGKFVQYQDQQVQKVLTSGFNMAQPEASISKDLVFYGALAMGAMMVFMKMGRA
jgi:hypothetical protein